MSDVQDWLRNGGAPRYMDLPDYTVAMYTNVKNTWQDAENLDDAHGYTSYIWIPTETHSVIVMKLAVFTEKFRAYSTGAASGGGTVVTSTAVTPNHTHDVNIGTKTSAAAGAHRHTMFKWRSNTPVTASEREYEVYTSPTTSMRVNVWTENAEDMLTFEEAPSHTHDVDIGTVTSASGGGSHSHDVTIPDHTHPISFGIYEEDISGRTLSAQLYDPDGNLLHDFGTILTGEGNVTLDLTSYFSTLKYGFYRVELSASGRMRVRLVFYELCRMYID